MGVRGRDGDEPRGGAAPTARAAGRHPADRPRGGRPPDLRDDDWAAERATIRLDPLRFTPEALRGLDAFSHVEVLYRFDRVDPAGVHTGARRPRGNPAGPEAGIFAQRAEDRPNRLGTSVCRLLAVRGLDVDVEGLDAVDGTPVLDLKPCIRGFRRAGRSRARMGHRLHRGYW